MTGPHGITRVLVVIQGTPSSDLLPNRVMRRGGHDAARVAKADARQIAKYTAVQHRNTCGGGPIFRGPVHVTERIVWGKGRRRCDIDAVPLLCKPLIDGLCDAGLIVNDAQITRLTVLEHDKDKDGPGWVEIQVEEVTA